MMFSAKNDNVIIVEIPNPRKLGTRGLGMKVTQQGGEGGGVLGSGNMIGNWNLPVAAFGKL